MIWKKLFGRGNEPVEGAAFVAEELPGQEESLHDADKVLNDALDWLDLTTARLQTEGLGNCERFNVDLAQGRIVFLSTDGTAKFFRCSAVGTHNPEKGSFRWAWDHPSIPVDVAGAALAARSFGEDYGLDAFTNREIEADEQDAWQFTGIAGLLSNAVGSYRCPGGTNSVYVVLYSEC
jgi:hypothetical protein